MFAVIAPATDLTLLTIAELRAAAVADNSQDATLLPLGRYVTSAITKACRVATDGATPPTLRLETVSDTFRSHSHGLGRHSYPARHRGHKLELSRKPIVEMISVVENGITLDPATDYSINKSAGLLTRLRDDRESWWCDGTIVVTDRAGYATAPDDLKYAVIKFVQAITQQAGRDPLLRFKRIEGLSEYRYDPTEDSIIPAEVMDLLEQGGFVNTWIG